MVYARRRDLCFGGRKKWASGIEFSLLLCPNMRWRTKCIKNRNRTSKGEGPFRDLKCSFI